MSAPLIPEQAEIFNKDGFLGVSDIYDFVPAIRPNQLGIYSPVGLLIEPQDLNIEHPSFSTEPSSSVSGIKEITAAKILQSGECGFFYP